MNVQAMTKETIYNEGIDALNERLGATGTVRFLQQTETGWGDYTEERSKWLGDPDLNELGKKIKKFVDKNKITKE